SSAPVSWRSRRRWRNEATSTYGRPPAVCAGLEEPAPMSGTAREILIRPLMTEKSMRQKEELNTVAFKVRPDANKVEIRTAVESVFNVKVTAVRTSSYEGKL